MSKYDLTIRASYTQLSDEQLDEHVQALKLHFLDAVARCDPNGVGLQWITSVHRRRAYI